MIALWCLVNGLIIFGGLSYFKVLRVDLETEKAGLDIFEHGGVGYSMDIPYPGKGPAMEGATKDENMLATHMKDGNNSVSHPNLPTPDQTEKVQSNSTKAAETQPEVSAPSDEPAEVEMEKTE